MRAVVMLASCAIARTFSRLFKHLLFYKDTKKQAKTRKKPLKPSKTSVCASARDRHPNPETLKA